MAGEPKVTPGLIITEPQVDEILTRDLKDTEDTINTLVRVALNQNEFDALVSLVFNIGPNAFRKSSVLRLLNKGDRRGAADAFLLWKKAGNDPDILLPRRQRERALFLVPIEAPQQPKIDVPATPVPAAQENWLVGLLRAFLRLFK